MKLHDIIDNGQLDSDATSGIPETCNFLVFTDELSHSGGAVGHIPMQSGFDPQLLYFVGISALYRKRSVELIVQRSLQISVEVGTLSIANYGFVPVVVF